MTLDESDDARLIKLREIVYRSGTCLLKE